MKRTILTFFALIGIITSVSCLHDRDNPNDPGAEDNLVDGGAVFQLRHGEEIVEANDEVLLEVADQGGYVDAVFYIDNKGTAYLALEKVQITVSDEFSVIDNPSTPIKPGKSTSFTIRFTPPAAQTEYSVNIYIYYDDGIDHIFIFTLTGIGNW